MSLNSVINNIQNTKWTKINNFGVQLWFNNEKILDLANFDYSQQELNEHLVKSIISVDSPTFTNAPIEEFVGYKWNFNNSRDELYRLTMSLRDFDNMTLYKNFLRLYRVCKGQYFENIKMTIIIYNEREYHEDVDQVFMVINDAVIDNISQLQFNNTTENQIAEFSIGFKGSEISLENDSNNMTY